NKKGKNEIIVFENSFHGRTIATLSSTGQKKFHEGFEPILGGFKYAKFNDLNSVKKLISRKTAGIMIELVQGEGGVNIAEKDFVKGLKNLCKKNKLLLIFDEIQTGLGRTGKLFGYEHYGVTPDIFTLAKSLGGGLPLGATIVKENIASVFNYGDHGSTFGGNPVSCVASLEVLKGLNPSLLKKVLENGKYFVSKLQKLKEKNSFIKDVRGLGLMVGMELDFKGADIVKFCKVKGVLINCTNDKVLRFLPPLIINKKDIDKVIEILEDAFIWQRSKK
ncbi:MAG: aminotransferase class III-fold pyridoxal phosphate-dependent enzyme, partial [Elusimicrobia bacterium]|nr:aminotransferase class III-fold pyridoxal phosphate-dependent enzyme [Elusimicrobiota bacterium]